jgi:hypothetical protein
MPDIQRLHYFDHQFLQEADFTAEQTYHLEMRRRHNKLLHTPGIAGGLTVEKTDAKQVTVRAGTAVNVKGEEIVLFGDFPIDVSNETDYPAKSTIYITIAYSERETDPQPPEDPHGNTRITEKPTIEAKTTSPPNDDTVIWLAKFTLDSGGNVPGNVGDELDGDVRKSVGSVLADNAVPINKLKKELREASDGTTLADGESVAFEVFKTELKQAESAFLLIYAYSVTPGAEFSWTQKYSTEGTEPNFLIKQTVTFKNEVLKPIEIKFKIYAVLEN